MLSCKETALLVSQSCDRRLSWRERLAVRLHLVFCDACTHFRRQMDFLRDVVRRHTQEREEVENEVRLPPSARERIARALERRQ
jgi:hypothetical protein